MIDHYRLFVSMVFALEGLDVIRMDKWMNSDSDLCYKTAKRFVDKYMVIV